MQKSMNIIEEKSNLISSPVYLGEVRENFMKQ